MTWTVTKKQSEEEWTKGYLDAVLASPPMPARVQRIGTVLVNWQEIDPGIAFVHSSGGTPDDRYLAEQIVVSRLAAHGWDRAIFSFDREHKTSDWDDIMAKAKRLINSGNVTILRNGYNNVVAHVVGDHGEYQCEIGRDDPDSRAITTWQCFLSDAPITMADGTRKAISEIVPGDEIISHKGRIRKVLKAWSRPYRGQMTTIKLRGLDEPFISTSNHPLWAANEDFHLERLAGWRGKMRLGDGGSPLKSEKGWRKASSIIPSDYLSFSFDNTEKPLFFENKEITPDLAYLLGWYTAEGYAIKSTKNRVGFSLNATEWHVAEELSAICEDHFDTPGTIRKNRREDYQAGWNTDFRVSSALFRQMVMTLIGTGSKTKRLAPELMQAPLEVQREFLRGWFEGDGSYDPHGRRHNLHTTSYDLAYQSRVLISRLGFDSNLSWNDSNFGNGFVKNAARIYRVRWNESRTRKDKERFLRDEAVWHRVESVTHWEHEGEVWDLEIEDDHSFQAYSINSHNCDCPWDQFAWQRTRKWKKYEGRPCHLPGATITMADGTFKSIEQVQEGEQVLTHNGIGTVTAVMARPYEGRAFSIFRSGFPEPIRLTENHEVWAVETPTRIREAAYNQSMRSGQGFRIYEDDFVSKEPEWIDSQTLAVHDWVASTWTDKEKETGSLPLATILGYYISEGNLAKRTRSDIWGEVQWTFHKDETQLHQELYDALKALNLESRTYHPRGRKTVSIRVTSTALANRLYELSGHLASKKELAAEVMTWPLTHQEAVIDAWAKGDGDLKKDGRQAINTSSPHLARGLYDLLVRCGYIPSWSIQQNNGGPSNRQAKMPIHRVTFKWTKKDKTNGRRRFANRYLSKITRIEEYWYSGLVWNLSVDGQESYVADGVTNHNCAHVLATFWQGQSTPLDPDAFGEEVPPGQAAPQPQSPADLGQQQLPFQEQGPMDMPQAPQDSPIQPGDPQPDPTAVPQPQAPGILPPFPGEQLQLVPPGTLQPGQDGITVSMPGARQPTPFNPIQNPSTYSRVENGNQNSKTIANANRADDEESWVFTNEISHAGIIAAQFNNSDMVRLEDDELMGVLQGKSEAHGAGQFKHVPKGSIGEVLGEDPTTGWVYVRFAGPQANAGPMEPIAVQAWIEPAMLTAMPNVRKPGPEIRRQR